MFHFGSKKQPEPETPWAVQFLTADYVIDGFTQPKDELFSTVADELNASFEGITLSNVKVQSLGRLTTPPQTFDKWGLAFAETVIAIIPGDDAARAELREAFPGDDLHSLVALYAGPFIIRGVLLGEKGAEIMFWKEVGFAAVSDAEIECCLPNATITKLSAPSLLINGGTLHGYGIL